jgi:surface polysaccharide O-acyltransferase-like enzyme
MKDKLLSDTISYLKFPLSVLVVFGHFNLMDKGFSVDGIMYDLKGCDVTLIKYIVLILSHELAHIAVPIFFIISGFLFFKEDRFDKEIYTNKIRKRIKSLAVPYFLWNLIAFIIKLITSLSSKNVEIHFSIPRLFNTFFYCDNYNGVFVMLSGPNKSAYPIDVPMWYVRDLMLIVIVSPLLYYVLKKAGIWFLVVSGLLWYITKTGFVSNYGYIFLTAQFYFSLGGYLRIKKLNMINEMRRFRLAPLLWVLLIIIDLIYNNPYAYYAGMFMGVFSMVQMVSRLLESGKVKVNKFLTDCSFFVFALHFLIMKRIAIAIFSILHLPNNQYVLFMAYFLIPTITIVICMLLYSLLKHKFPTFCNLLTGGR